MRRSRVRARDAESENKINSLRARAMKIFAGEIPVRGGRESGEGGKGRKWRGGGDACSPR